MGTQTEKQPKKHPCFSLDGDRNLINAQSTPVVHFLMSPVETRYGKKTNHGRVFCIDPCFFLFNRDELMLRSYNIFIEAVFFFLFVLGSPIP